MKKAISLILASAMLALAGCGAGVPAEKPEGLSVIATIFPAYDFARELLGDGGEVTLLVPPGAEIHSYEPTPQDIISISSCDVFIYNGGESDEWVDEVLESAGGDMLFVRMTECCQTVTEEIKEGMETDGEGGDEPDEHVWTSPVNAIEISRAIAAAFSDRDPEGAEGYAARLAAYEARLRELDASFREVTENAARDTLVFADRFPARYFTEEYALDYFAAYPGCAEQTEASARTVAFLTDKVADEGLPYVLYIEFSNEKTADVICEETGCGKLRFHSCHTVSAADMQAGATYISLMEENLESIRLALN